MVACFLQVFSQVFQAWSYLVNLVQQVDAGDVRPVALHHVDQVVGCGVAPQSDVRVVDPVDKVRIN